MSRLLVTLGALLAVVAAPASAEIYRRVDQFGNITYTNLPPKGAEDDAKAVTAPAAKRADKPSGSGTAVRVSAEDQHSRDEESRRILGEELKKEQDALAAATASKSTEAAARHQANVDALKREIARLK